MVKFAIGLAVGYVLGAKAGRERYNEIVEYYQRAKQHPMAQSVIGTAQNQLNKLWSRLPNKTARQEEMFPLDRNSSAA